MNEIRADGKVRAHGATVPTPSSEECSPRLGTPQEQEFLLVTMLSRYRIQGFTDSRLQELWQHPQLWFWISCPGSSGERAKIASGMASDLEEWIPAMTAPLLVLRLRPQAHQRREWETRVLWNRIATVSKPSSLHSSSTVEIYSSETLARQKIHESLFVQHG